MMMALGMLIFRRLPSSGNDGRAKQDVADGDDAVNSGDGEDDSGRRGDAFMRISGACISICEGASMEAKRDEKERQQYSNTNKHMRINSHMHTHTLSHTHTNTHSHVNKYTHNRKWFCFLVSPQEQI
jgi:hypothetical protein